jgi:hypothetical protein
MRSDHNLSFWKLEVLLVCTLRAVQVWWRERNYYCSLLTSSVSLSTMSTATRRDVFVTSTPASFRRNVSREHILHATNTLGPRGTVDGGHHGSLDQRGNGISALLCSESADLRTVKRVLDVLKGGDMDVVGFLDALCWGNQKAIADPSTKAARTNLTHSDNCFALVASPSNVPRWIDCGRCEARSPTTCD